MTPTVHILCYGRVLCGQIHGLPMPCNWGPGQKWVSIADPWWPRDATCPTCRQQAGLIAEMREPRAG